MTNYEKYAGTLERFVELIIQMDCESGVGEELTRQFCRGGCSGDDEEAVCTDENLRKCIITWLRKDAEEAADKELLTQQELQRMAGKPVYCPEIDSYGIIKYETKGIWAGVPFLVGTFHRDEVAVNFEYNIADRNLKCYRIVEDKQNPDCYTSEPDNPYPLCIGRGLPKCGECQLRADWEPDDPYGVGA